MAAGLGFKTFTTGEVLTAGDVNGYLMQGINVFASEAARNAAITSPQEGQFAFTKDTNSTWYYDGAAWVASGASGDVTGVTAGTGITVTDPTGPVPTVTNSMATAITTNGDLIYGTGSGTFTRRAIGSTGDVLTVSGGVPTWAAPAGGGKVLQVVYATYATETTNTTTTMADTGLSASITPSLATSKVAVFVSQSIYANRNGTDAGANVDLRRNSTTIWNTAGIDATVFIGGATANTIQTKQQMSIVCLDSPATTSATTYKTRFQTNGGTARAQQNSHISSIILMEIGA